MTHLLDTSTCVGILRGKSPAARLRLIETGKQAALCSVVLFELRAGVLKSDRPIEERLKVDKLSRGLKSLPFDDQTASIAAQTRVYLEERGQKVGPYDLLIAAIALQHALILVTSNVHEFSRIPNLRLEDWEA